MMTDPARKDDRADHKNRLDLLPFDALEAVGEVYTFGAGKYDDRNWEKGLTWGRVLGAIMRHLFAWARGEDYDQESGLLHTTHATWGCLTLVAYQLRKVGEDDRPKVVQYWSPPPLEEGPAMRGWAEDEPHVGEADG